jgi:hypothetical protein
MPRINHSAKAFSLKKPDVYSSQLERMVTVRSANKLNSL